MARTHLVVDVDLREEDFRREPINVTINGLGTYQFPGVAPASARLRVARWEAAGRHDDTLTPADVIALVGDIVPDDVMADWSRKGFDWFHPKHLAAIEQMVRDLMAEWGRRDLELAAMESAGKGAPPAASQTPPPFFGTGRSSSPTSGATTGSNSPGT